MSEERVVYSIQKTYIIKPVFKPDKLIFTCDERIDIPTIEPLTKKVFETQDEFLKIIPCIELTGIFSSEFDLKFEFETNDGVTVLPVKIARNQVDPQGNPYTTPRYVLVLPRGATGVKSCKIIQEATGNEFQHNFTFGVMPPPYNYDNALFGFLTYGVVSAIEVLPLLDEEITNLNSRVTALENKAGG